MTDLSQSESCGLAIPEIGLALQAGTLGGRFTTLEGILDQVYEELSEKVFASGDSHGDDGAFEGFLKKLKEVRDFCVVFVYSTNQRACALKST